MNQTTTETEGATTDSSIRLKPVYELLGESYLIPHYQRGYRWGTQQVKELLEDINGFQSGENSDNKAGFYCLQPIVLKAISGSEAWEVVDGQQRLTTIYLILHFFNQRMTEEFQKELYSLDYQTREMSKEFLMNPTEERSKDFIDFHFMYQAILTIKEWFSDKVHLISDFEGTLLNRVKVIWYELPESESAVDAFTRLNVGKIPLTNAELVRALFLRSRNFPQVTADLEQLKIAQEWDLMERSLQQNDFWYFLTEDVELTNRIELLFNLITEANPGENTYVDDKLASFHRFNELISDENHKPEDLWDEVKQYFMTLQEWYADQTLFHLVGYLIHQGDSLLKLVKLSRETGKAEFCTELKQRILKKIDPNLDLGSCTHGEMTDCINGHLNRLEYGSPRVKQTLLLFNIASIIANDKSIVRFRFDYFKQESWDIEHIRSVASGRPRANVDKKPWLEVLRDYFDETGENQELHQRASEMLELQSYTTGDAFDQLYDEIISHFEEQESDEAEDGIGNLALLDSGTNRGYKNAVFPVKRRKLLKYDQEGTFVPLCTRNAFLKCYSENLDQMFFWRKDDQDDYRTAMANCLINFFTR